MIKLSRQTKEIVKTILFFGAVALLLLVYVIYPLSRSKKLMARSDIDQYNQDSLVANDAGAYLQAGLPVDTFRFESDAMTILACLKVPAKEDTGSYIRGTAILLHDDGANRDSLINLARMFHDTGFAVITLDLRAAGKTTGKYRGEGYLEATDIQSLISHLEIHGQISHPLLIVGYGRGAEAARLTTFEEQRVDAVIAVRPYLTTKRMQDILKQRYDTYWFPFYRTIMWWWYNIRSGYGAPYRDTENLRPVEKPTVIYLEPQDLDIEEINRLKEISSGELLEVLPLPAGDQEIFEKAVSLAATIRSNS
ncbi:MAG: hypothetical protein AB1483_01465 [Candidatus Zixiibacteriota bacterium]